MAIGKLETVLLWAACMNYAILLVWFGAFLSAHDRIFRLHTRWFQLSVEAFDAINYAGLAAYKIGNMLFFVVPLIALVVSP